VDLGFGCLLIGGGIDESFTARWGIVKQYRTRFLRLVAVVFIIFPLLYIILAGTLFDIPLKSCLGIMLSPSYYFVSILVAVSGYGLWEILRWSWYVVIVSQVFLSYENAVFVFNYSESHHKLAAYLISLLLQLMVVYRIAQEVRVPYLFPKIRWWESNPRYRVSVVVSITRSNGQIVEGEILDLSLSGCFVKVRPDLILHERVLLTFKMFENEINAEGNLVWLAQSAVTHPKGIGVKFGLLQRSQKRVLKVIVRKLKKIAVLYRRSRYLMSQEEFIRKLEEIEHAG
jgi:hypothetical protein